MVGINAIGTYLPERRVDNLGRLSEFDMEESFVVDKLGIKKVSRKATDQETSDLAVLAFENLEKRTGLNLRDIEVLILVTQNPDYSLPHTSAVIHQKLDINPNCACFDISLGCSGFVYGLSVIKNFMEGNGMKKGVLLTADPYSKVINDNDKNTTLLFGDGAAATLLTDDPKLDIGKFTFGTLGKKHDSLIVNDGILSMKGRAIFNFVSVEVPKDLSKALKMNEIDVNEVDRFLLHPGSKYVVDSVINRAKLPEEKVVFNVQNYGNTVSSSIPFLLEDFIDIETDRMFLLSGFGVGLSWSTTVLRRR